MSQESSVQPRPGAHNDIDGCNRVRSSVVERSTADRMVAGSIPAVPLLFVWPFVRAKLRTHQWQNNCANTFINVLHTSFCSIISSRLFVWQFGLLWNVWWNFVSWQRFPQLKISLEPLHQIHWAVLLTPLHFEAIPFHSIPHSQLLASELRLRLGRTFNMSNSNSSPSPSQIQVTSTHQHSPALTSTTAQNIPHTPLSHPIEHIIVQYNIEEDTCARDVDICACMFSMRMKWIRLILINIGSTSSSVSLWAVFCSLGFSVSSCRNRSQAWDSSPRLNCQASNFRWSRHSGGHLRYGSRPGGKWTQTHHRWENQTNWYAWYHRQWRCTNKYNYSIFEWRSCDWSVWTNFNNSIHFSKSN